MFERFVKGIIEKEGRKAVIEIALDDISVNPYQPRKHFDQKKLEELSTSIKQQGVIQPIIVRRLGAGYELVAGERRLRASRMIGNRTIPAIVRRLDDHDMIEFAFIENLQREQLNLHEEAEAYCRLLQESGEQNERALAKRIGKNPSAIRRKMWMLRLSHAVKKAVISKLISIEHAHALSRISDEKTQMHMLERIHREKLSPAAAEKLVEELPETLKYDEEAPGQDDASYLADAPEPEILDGCIKLMREYVSAVRAAGIDVETAADFEDGCLRLKLNFKISEKKD